MNEYEVGARVCVLVREFGGEVGGVCECCFYARCCETEEGDWEGERVRAIESNVR